MFNLEDLDQLFPLKYQERYARHIKGQRDLSPIRARYFVRLWAYACLCRKGPPYKPIQTLDSKLYDFPLLLSQADAQKIIYAGQKSTRAAGLMLKRFEEANLIQCQPFKGTKTEITFNIPIEFNLLENTAEIGVFPDAFDCRKDLLSVRLFLKELYSVNTKIPERQLEANITWGLRNWAKRYPKGMRVIRRTSDREAVGFLTIMPVSLKSEENFFEDPHESLHLSQFSSRGEDPIKIAEKDEADCYMVYIRSWQIHPELWTHKNVLALLEETKRTLLVIKSDYPDLSVIYSMTIHPRLEKFAHALGFKTTSLISNASLRWLCIQLDTFLKINSESVVKGFSLDK